MQVQTLCWHTKGGYLSCSQAAPTGCDNNMVFKVLNSHKKGTKEVG